MNFAKPLARCDQTVYTGRNQCILFRFELRQKRFFKMIDQDQSGTIDLEELMCA